MNDDSAKTSPQELISPGPISAWLGKQGLKHNSLEKDHLGIEVINVEPSLLFVIATALKDFGFDYLQCQGGYDEGPGERLSCFYNFIALGEIAKETGLLNLETAPREVRLKVFVPREGHPVIPSLYSLFKGADWQERETYDMFGIHFEDHPHPKRLLMPEDWKGWPLRKDYIQPDFYEMQDAY